MSTTSPRRSGRRKGLVVAQREADRRRRLVLVSAAVAILVLVAAVIGFGLYRAQQHAAAVVVPRGATEQGIPIGNPGAGVTLDLYEDFQCPVCKQFEEVSGPTIDELIRAGTIRVIYHPVAFLDRMSTTTYSSRASAAAGCAAADGIYPKFATGLFTHQPPEGGVGLPTETVIALGEAAGAGPDFVSCVQNGTHAGWSRQLTDTASRNGVTATPTVRVNGHEVTDCTPAGLKAAIAAVHPH
ncbi:MAG TPA: thioredoxin domain-containing protein [Pseudonocardiaceae bacterium]